MATESSYIAVVGDVHGHLQLALCVLARWQQELGRPFDAVFLCGDVGTFTHETQLDGATRAHARTNPCELEFLTQWAVIGQTPWLDAIFRPLADDGLGLTCPVIMVHGNHEGFAHLERLVATGIPRHAMAPDELPSVDPHGHIRLLPSGWQVVLPGGQCVAGVGGMERGQRKVAYHPMAYLDEAAVNHLARRAHVAVLVTHQGPAATQETGGAPTLNRLLDAGVARAWFHGHSVRNRAIVCAGPGDGTTVVPLHGIPFAGHGPEALPGPDGWARVELSGDTVAIHRETPPFLRDFRRKKWSHTPGNLLISPALAPLAWKPLRTHKR